MNHKRRGPKSTRSGCLLCKPMKHQAFKHSERAKAKLSWRRHEERANG